MMSELPPTSLNTAENHHGQAWEDDPGLHVPPFDPWAVEHERARFNSPRQDRFEMQGLTAMPGDYNHPAAAYWCAEMPRPPDRIRLHPFPSGQGIDPLPYNLAIPGDASPDWWRAGDLPVREQNSSTVDSSRSALTVEDRPEMDPGSYGQVFPWADVPCGEWWGGGSPGYDSPTAPGIALCDIEPGQGVDAEKFSGRPAMGMPSNHPYLVEPGVFAVTWRPPTRSSMTDPDENPGSSSVPEDDGDRITDSEIQDEDTSDYSPKARRKHFIRRGPSRAVIPTGDQPKRPVRSRPSTSSQVRHDAKITKRITTPKALAPISATGRLTLPKRDRVTSRPKCSQCAGIYQSESALHKHMLASHTRPFVCTFRRYGCPSTFGSKNEWKRHVSSQHLRLGIYRCDMDKCVSDSRAGLGRLRGYNDFNRKDLFTQHVRRMHGPAIAPSGNGMDASDASLEVIRQRCWVSLRETPPASICGFCAHGGRTDPDRGTLVTWDSPGSWDDRMEHVGRHLEKNEAGEAEDEDVGLREWMLREKLLTRDGAGGWLVVGCGGRKRGKGAVAEMRGRLGAGSGVRTSPDVELVADDGGNEDLDGDCDDPDGEVNPP